MNKLLYTLSFIVLVGSTQAMEMVQSGPKNQIVKVTNKSTLPVTMRFKVVAESDEIKQQGHTSHVVQPNQTQIIDLLKEASNPMYKVEGQLLTLKQFKEKFAHLLNNQQAFKAKKRVHKTGRANLDIKPEELKKISIIKFRAEAKDTAGKEIKGRIKFPKKQLSQHTTFTVGPKIVFDPRKQKQRFEISHK